jgi:HTH-type transcriptional regulator / antitoxin HigA
MEPRVIKSESQYREYLDEVDKLVDLDPEPDTPEGARLELLALLVEAYEKERFQIPLPSPIDAILFRMEQQGLKQKDLIPYIGSKSRVSEVLAGKRPLTLKMASALSAGLGIPAAALLVNLKDPNAEDPSVGGEDIEWSRFPIREMLRRGWLAARSGAADAKELMLDFLGKLDGSGVGPAFLRRTVHLGTQTPIDVYALNAWLARVIIRSREQKEKWPSYRKENLSVDVLKEVARLSWFEKGPLLAQEFLAKKGVVLVVEPSLPRTRLDGAALLDGRDQTPVIGLTLRHDCIDSFWFTLLHELAHVIKHLKGKQEVYVDDTDQEVEDDEKEVEANQLARGALIPRAIWRRSDAYHFQTLEAIQELAQQLEIHPAIIAGRLRRDTGNYRLFPKLVGQGKVRVLFSEMK